MGPLIILESEPDMEQCKLAISRLVYHTESFTFLAEVVFFKGIILPGTHLLSVDLQNVFPGQSHVYALMRSLHEACLGHGLLAHSSISGTQSS